MALQYVHLGSRTISYLDSHPSAKGLRVLVLVHAFPLGAGMWKGQLKTLPEGWRLIAPDLRGFGGSTIPTPDDTPDMDDYASDVLDLLDEIGVKSMVLGGCSLGGYAAFAVFRRAPEKIKALALIDTRAGADSPEGRANRRGMLALLEREGPSGVARDMLPKLLGATTKNDRPDVEPLVRRLIKQHPSEALRGAIERMMSRPDSRPLLQQVKVPTLVLVGEEDVLTPPDESRAMAAAIRGAELVVLPRVGHLPNLEEPHAFDEALSGFLKRLA